MARLWINFSSHQLAGREECEGVLLVPQSQSEPELRVVLIDGSDQQLEFLERLTRSSDRPVEISWVISHYHDDHFIVGARRLLEEPLDDYLKYIYAPFPRTCPRFEGRDDSDRLQLIRKLVAKRRTPQNGLQVHFGVIGVFEDLYDSDGVSVYVCGGPVFAGDRKINENARSLVVVATSRDRRRNAAFVSPGDAHHEAWTCFMETIRRQNNRGFAPAKLLKLAHHGAIGENPSYAMQYLLGNDWSQSVAVRIRNRCKKNGEPFGTQRRLQERLTREGLECIDTHDEVRGEGTGYWVCLDVEDGRLERHGNKDPDVSSFRPERVIGVCTSTR